jgi:predicted DNA-binding transcriptional regulator AlpA
MRLLRYKDLGPEKGIWFSRTHISRMTDPESEWYDPDFPAPIKLGTRNGWYEHEIDAYLETRPRRKPTTTLPDEEQDTVKLLPRAQGQLPDYSDHNVTTKE